MFDLTLKGYGLGLIVRELTQDKVPVWGRSTRGRSTHDWTKAYVRKILSGRTVLGEFQMSKSGKPYGEVLPDYYPSVVDESSWLQVQAALERRRDRRGPVGKNTSPDGENSVPTVATLFGGLLRDAETGNSVWIAFQTRGSVGRRYRRRVLVTARAVEGAAAIRSFPYDIFEKAVLWFLKEVNPADVLGREPESESVILAAELAVKEQRMRMIEAELIGDGDDIPTLVRVVRSLSAECDVLRKRLAVIRQKEANPRSVAWSEALTLINVAKDEANRLRLRDLIHSIVEEIWVLVVPRQPHRLAAVQIYFQGDGRRDYLIHYQAAGYHRAGDWSAGSLRSEIAPSDLDLRRKADVKALQKRLSEVNIEVLVSRIKGVDEAEAL
jgi:hypothetical protein